MKKQLLSLIIFVAAKSFSQTIIFSENFQGISIPSIPANWNSYSNNPDSIGDSGGSSSLFMSGNSSTASSTYFTVPGNSIFVYTNDDTCNCDKSSDFLEMPEFDFTGYNSLNLKFYSMMNPDLTPQYLDSAFVESSVDGGLSWQKIFAIPKIGTWTNYNVSLGAFDNMPNTLLRFSYRDFGNWGYGIAIDSVRIEGEEILDASVSEFLLPISGCTLGIESVSVYITNFGYFPITNIPVFYSVNGGTAVSETITDTVNPGENLLYSFILSTDLSGPGNYTLNSWTSLPADANPFNDSLTNYTITNGSIGNFPYYQDFESGQGGWISGGTNSSWAFGTPAKSEINSAGSGINSWVTGGLDALSYNPSENSFVSGPCFDFSTLTEPIIELKIWWSSEYTYDGTVLQSSLDDGATWQNVGAIGDGTNWFNYSPIYALPGGQPEGWSGQIGNFGSNGWITVKHDLSGLAGETNIHLRIAFASDDFVEVDGFAFDDVKIYNKPPFDVGVASLITPSSSCSLSSSEYFTVAIVNYGTAITDFIPVFYQVNGGAIVSDTSYLEINPGDTLFFTFSDSTDLSASGTYFLSSWTGYSSDGLSDNDSLSNSLIIHPATIGSFSYFEDFETGPGGWYSGGINGSWAFGTPAKYVINSAGSGANSWVTGGLGNTYYNTNEKSFVASPCFDFSGLTLPMIEIMIWYEIGNGDGAVMQSSIDGGASWQNVGALGDALNWYNNGQIYSQPGGQPIGWSGSWNAGTKGWILAKHYLNGLGGQSNVQLRIAFASSNSWYDGFAFDNIKIYEAPQYDIAIVSVDAPGSGCNLSSSEAVTIRISNLGYIAADSIPVSYRINGGMPVNAMIYTSISPGYTVYFTFPDSADLSAVGSYSFDVWSAFLPDTINNNDTMSNYEVAHIQMINTFPYIQDFESGYGNWYSGGSNSSWAFGTPAKNIINSAASGVNSWVTGGLGTASYSINEKSFVGGPCFDFSGLNNPIVELKLWWEAETDYDGAVLQSSIDDGISWQNIGNLNDPYNWYNNGQINGQPGGQTIGWSGSSGTGSNGWLSAKHHLSGLGGQSKVQLRIAFASDGSVEFDGFALDDISIYEAPSADVGVVSIISPKSACSLSSTENITIVVANLGSASQSGIPVFYSVNGDTAVADTISGSLGVGDTVTYTFSSPYDFSSYSSYSLDVWTSHPADSSNGNDSITGYEVINYFYSGITSFPYNENFESGDGGWSADGFPINNDTISTWQLGVPSASFISSAASGNNAWVTNLYGNYAENEYSYLESPILDFSSMNLDPVLQFSIIYNTEGDYDGAWLEFSDDGGNSWNVLGNTTSGINWYNNNGSYGYNWWDGNSGTSGTWLRAGHQLSGLAGVSCVKLRFVFKADFIYSYEGIGLDSIGIFEPPPLSVQKAFGRNQEDVSQSVIQISDGSYIMSGYTKSFGSGNNDFYLLKTDAGANILWSKSYGGSLADVGYMHRQTNDGGFIIVGTTNSFGAGGDIFVVKTDINGNLLWTKNYGGSGYEEAYSIQQTIDGGYIIAGYTTSFGVNGDAYLIKTNASGGIQWTQTYGGQNQDYAWDIKQLGNGGYILVGGTMSFGSGGRDILVINVSPAGSVLWAKTYGGAQDENIGNIEISGNTYLVTGTTNSFGSVNGDTYFLMMDNTGNIIMANKYSTGYAHISKKITNATLGYIITGSLVENFLSDAFAIKTDINGNVVWAKSYGGSQEEFSNDVAQTSDFGYVISGNTKSFGSGSSDVYFVKTNPMGSSSSCNEKDITVTKTPVTFLTQTPGLSVGSGGMSATSSTVVTIANTIETEITPPIQPICLITVDSTSTKNLVVWEKPASPGSISHFNIYRDIVGNYALVGTVPYDSLSVFVDTTNGINPKVTSYKYKITVVDVCNFESDYSDFHKTIHLTTNLGTQGKINLIWDGYEGFYTNFFYRILRDTSGNGNFQVLDSVSKTNFTWTDTLPSDNSTYIVEVVKPGGGCLAQKAPQNHNSSRSNSSLAQQPSSLSAQTVVTNATSSDSCNGIATVSVSGGVSPYTFQWDGNAGNQTTAMATGLCPGTYSLVVMDANGTSTIVFATVGVSSGPTLTATTSSVNSSFGNCDGSATVNASGGVPPYSYQWDGNTGNQTSSTATGLCAGTYSVVVTDANGNSTIVFATIGTAVPIIEITSQYGISLSPNPSRGVFTLFVKTILPSEMELSIYDVLGQEVKKEKISKSAEQMLIDISEKSNGVYYVIIRGENKIANFKMIIEK